MPAAEPKPSIGSQESCRDGRAEKTRYRNRGREQSDDPCAMLCREPIRQIKNDAGKEACFCSTEKQPHHIKRLRASHERHPAGQHAPRDHDAGNPAASTELLQEKVAGHLEQKVREKENSAAEAEDGRGQMKILDHLQRSETQVHPVDERDEVGDHQEGHDAQGHLPHRSCFDCKFARSST